MRNMFNEFRKFAVRGNVIDMAVGIIIGAAFTKIVQSMVNDVITPPIGLLTGGIDFSELTLTLREPLMDEAGQVTQPALLLAYGRLITVSLEFLIVAVVVFFLIKGINKLRQIEELALARALARQEAERAPEPQPAPPAATATPADARLPEPTPPQSTDSVPSLEAQLLAEIRDLLARQAA